MIFIHLFLIKERSYANSLLKGKDTDTKGRNNWLPFRPRAISLPLTYLYFLIRENLFILHVLSVVLAHPLAPIFRLVPKMNMRWSLCRCPTRFAVCSSGRRRSLGRWEQQRPCAPEAEAEPREERLSHQSISTVHQSPSLTAVRGGHAGCCYYYYYYCYYDTADLYDNRPKMIEQTTHVWL